MSRLARTTILLAALLASLVPLQPVFAAGVPEPADAGLGATVHDLLARLWEPVARVFSTTDGGSTKDPNGGTRAAAEAGPGWDPDGSADPPPSGSETDGGPGMDPDG